MMARGVMNAGAMCLIREGSNIRTFCGKPLPKGTFPDDIQVVSEPVLGQDDIRCPFCVRVRSREILLERAA